MPHFEIQYSANLDDVVDMGGLCERIRATAAQIEAFPTAGIRVRAIRVDHYAIADGQAKHGFIDLGVRLRAGRSGPVKQDAMQRVFDVMQTFVAPAMAKHSIALSAEMREIDADLAPKTGTIRDHMEDSA